MSYEYHKPDGTVEIRELTQEQREAIDAWHFNVNKQRAELGLEPLPNDIEIIGFWESA